MFNLQFFSTAFICIFRYRLYFTSASVWISKFVVNTFSAYRGLPRFNNRVLKEPSLSLHAIDYL